MLEIEYGREAWLKDSDAAYAEAVRRIRLTRDATDPKDRETIWFSDLGALKAIPPGLGEIEGLVTVEVGAARTPDGEFHEPYQGITSLAPLMEATGLRRLNLHNIRAKDLSPLRHLTKLRELDLGGNRALSDIAPLAGCAELRSLILERTQVTDIAPLAACVALRDLDLDTTDVADISPLAACAELMRLNLRGTYVNDISPLLRIGRFATMSAEALDIGNVPAVQQDMRLFSISTLSAKDQARDVIAWLRGQAVRESESRIRRASDIAVVLSDDLIIAIDRLGPEGAARKGREAMKARMAGLRIIAADLAHDAGQTDLAGSAPRDISEALRLYAERAAPEAPLYYALLGPAATIRATLEAGEQDQILRQMKPGFLARLRLLIQQHEEIAPWFRPAEEVAEELARTLPPLRADADVQSVIDDAEQIADDASRLVAEKIADPSLLVATQAVAEDARNAAIGGDRIALSRVTANLLSLVAGIRDEISMLMAAANGAFSHPVETMGKILIVKQFVADPYTQILIQWLQSHGQKILHLFEIGTAIAPSLPPALLI